jgi:hypothetical protein
MRTFKVSPGYTVIICILVIFAGIATMKGLARSQAHSLIKNEQIMQNYDKFQEIAKEKGIAMMPNDKALEVPEIKAVLAERDALLAKIAPNCTIEYKAKMGIAKASFNPFKAECKAFG